MSNRTGNSVDSGCAHTNDFIIRIPCEGYSMGPLINEKATLIVDVSPMQQYKIGDIVIFKLNKKTIAHRIMHIVSKKNNVFVSTKGDANKFLDHPMPQHELLGKVISIEYADKCIDLISFKHAGFSYLFVLLGYLHIYSGVNLIKSLVKLKRIPMFYQGVRKLL